MNSDYIRILLVCGTFDINNGKRSGLIDKIARAISHTISAKNLMTNINAFNGGNYSMLETILDMTPDYDIVFWFADVDNSLPKIRDVKAVAPKTMLVTSKRNDDDKYSFQELVQRQD